MSSRLAVAAAVVLCAAVAGCGGDGVTAERGFSGGAAGDGQAQDFTLSDAWGDRVRLSDQRGRLVLLAFLYTSCRDVCPLIAQNLNGVLRGLGEQRDEVRVLAVSVDPGRDTAFAVRDYVRMHRLLPQFRYLIGGDAELRRVWQAYNVLASARNVDVIDHSAPIVLIDEAGAARLVYDSHADSDAMLGDIRLLLER